MMPQGLGLALIYGIALGIYLVLTRLITKD